MERNTLLPFSMTFKFSCLEDEANIHVQKELAGIYLLEQVEECQLCQYTGTKDQTFCGFYIIDNVHIALDTSASHANLLFSVTVMLGNISASEKEVTSPLCHLVTEILCKQIVSVK